MDFGFAKITAQGRAEFPDAGFEKGPVDVAKASVVQHTYLMFGDGYKLSDNSMQFAFNMDGNVNTSMGSDFRYAGKYFKQKISACRIWIQITSGRIRQYTSKNRRHIQKFKW